MYCNVRYKNHIFEAERKITPDKINADLLKNADKTIYYHNSVSGTGTVIYYDGTKAAVLSCAHTFQKPDTIITYFGGSDKGNYKYIQSIAIKDDQYNLVYGFPGNGHCDILLKDTENDILILEREIKRKPEEPIAVLDYPFGNAHELEWGSFVYLIGYPRGYQIITKGIVSHPNRTEQGSFLIDALFNVGMSGGIILAIRDGVPNFEMVGITTSAAAEYNTVLVPERRTKDYDETIPYEGEIYVNNRKNITYGITRAISTEAILNLMKNNAEMLAQKGYDFKRFSPGGK